MTLPTAAERTLIAFQRFGLGPKPGGPARIGSDPAGAIRAEVARADIARIVNPALPSYAFACAEAQRGHADRINQLERNARVDKHMSVEIGFVERLVIFWSNHFSMNANKSDAIRGTIGQWERNVVRKHVLGRFSDMLHGTMAHPAMIAFLDNEESIGPNSSVGQQEELGFNENLARESMELHTLGSGGGYTEADVTAYARILTGWSYVRDWEASGHYNGGGEANRGQFIYRPKWHEPGAIRLMGKVYPGQGQRQAEAVFDDLAKHPATAEHIAFKLVRHFITDEPTPAMVNRLAQKFLDTSGNLREVSLELLRLPEGWLMPLTKFRTPYENAIAQFRALGVRYGNDDTWAFEEPLNVLRQALWESPSPEGYSDETPTWLNPNAMRIRLDVAQLIGDQLGKHLHRNILALGISLFGPALSQETRERMAGSGSNDNALTILFSCPEFQRR